MSASQYEADRLRRMGTSFDQYKRPTQIRAPRNDYDTSVAAPTAVSSSEYLRKRYGTFAGATEIGPPPVAVPQVEIMGKKALTVGDLKLLRNAVDRELLRVVNLRVASATLRLKQSQLEALADNLADVTGRVERGEIRVENVAIFPAVAKTFLRTLTTSENVPDLFDPEGRSPSSLGLTGSPAPAPAAPAPATIATKAAVEPTSSGQELVQWMYENIQNLKWELEANYDIEAAKHREMQDTLDTMESRVLAYSYGDSPMPSSYRSLFLSKIRELQAELKPTPE